MKDEANYMTTQPVLLALLQGKEITKNIHEFCFLAVILLVG